MPSVLMLGSCKGPKRYLKEGKIMKKIFSFTIASLLLCTGAQAQQHEADRLRHAGEVLMEILNIPDNIPKSVLDKSECVIVIPPVKKLAFRLFPYSAPH